MRLNNVMPGSKVQYSPTLGLTATKPAAQPHGPLESEGALSFRCVAVLK